MSVLSNKTNFYVCGLALAVAVLFSALALLNTGGHTNSDEIAYRHVLESMNHGQGYYAAARDGLKNKEGRAPSKVRAIRPPSMYLLLYKLPSGWRSHAAALPVSIIFAATYFIIASLGGPKRGFVAMALVAHWMWVASEFLPLHAELWGLAPASAAIACLATKRWRSAIVLLGLAVLFRELYGALLVISFIAIPKTQLKTMAMVGGALLIFYALHAHMAAQVLDPNGYQPGLNGTINVGITITALTFGLDPFWRLEGLAVFLVGLIMLVERARLDRTALVMAIYGLVAAFLTIKFGRNYWGVIFAPIIVSGAALIELKRRPQDVPVPGDRE